MTKLVVLYYFRGMFKSTFFLFVPGIAEAFCNLAQISTIKKKILGFVQISFTMFSSIFI
jgi:hypothetical protein